MQTNRNLNQEPEQEWVRSNPDGSLYIPINTLEDLLDELEFSTKNFHHFVYKNSYGLILSGSIELTVTIDGIQRTFVGAASFELKGCEFHDTAKLKSECIKNAATDIGRKYGRHINEGREAQSPKPPEEAAKEALKKLKPDMAIIKQFEKAIRENDAATIALLSNVYQLG